jgi:hypothetical protein
MLGRVSRIRTVTGIVATAVLSCGAPGVPSDPTAVDRLCTSACARRSQCLAGEPSMDTCRADCSAHRGRWAQFGGGERKYWRDDYVAAVVQCTNSAGCEVIDDDTRYRGQCWADTEVAPSALAHDFCERLDREVHECGGLRNPRCLDRFGAMSDAALKGLTRCIDQDCREAVRCWSAFLASAQD